MSLDASGTIAKTLTASKWKGRNYIRQRVIPLNPQSPAQQEVRAGLASAGRANSFVETGSDVDVSAKANAPSDQSWAGYLASLQIERYAQSDTDYNNVTYADEKGYFDAGAATLGLQPITIPGETPVEIPAGLILWNMYSAVHFFDTTSAPSAATAATAGNITTFLAALAA